jgi:hypothetical protein
MRIVHLLDGSTPADSVEVLARLLALEGEHRVVVLGHRSTARLLRCAGIDLKSVTWIHSVGALDFLAGRMVRRVVRDFGATHVHAWGTAAAIAASMIEFDGTRVATITDVPRRGKLLAMLAGRARAVQWVASSRFLKRELEALGLSPVEVIPLAATGRRRMEAGELRRMLGIGPADFPVILHGGEGGNARQDFGIWTSAVLAQLYPGTRLILREDARTQVVPGLEKYGQDLERESLVIAAPYELSWGDLLSVADVFLVTATGPIPTGSVVEAISAGVPIVATPVGGVKELLRHGETGLIAKHIGVGIAPPRGRKTIRPRAIAGELERLLSTQGLAARLGETARAEGLGLDEGRVVERYRDLYDGIGAREATIAG